MSDDPFIDNLRDMVTQGLPHLKTPMDSELFLASIDSAEGNQLQCLNKVLEVENKFGNMMIYKREGWDMDDCKYIMKKELQLRKLVCGPCGVAAGRVVKVIKKPVIDIERSRKHRIAFHTSIEVPRRVNCEGCRCLELKRSLRDMIHVLRMDHDPEYRRNKLWQRMKKAAKKMRRELDSIVRTRPLATQ